MMPSSAPSPRELLVDFVVRSDSPTKSGGDSLQVAEYVSRLEARGVRCRVLPFSPALRFRPHAIVHIVNVDRPFDFLHTVKSASDHPIIVSPIHHDLTFVRQMRLGERGFTPRAVLGRLLPEAWRELLAFGVRSLLTASGRRDRVAAVRAGIGGVRSVFDVWRRVGFALDEVESVALLAEGEGRSLQRDTSWSGRNAVLIPNGHPVSFDRRHSGPDATPRKLGILSVGRIEPRKRQLEVAIEACRQGVSVTFVGPAPAGGSKYAEQFAQVVADSDGLLAWRGAVPHAQVLELMTEARVLINASWVEVQSLVDIEAAFSGCRVVVAPGGNSQEALPKHVHEVRGGLPDVVREAAKLAQLPTPPAYPEAAWSWDDAADALTLHYRRAADSSAITS